MVIKIGQKKQHNNQMIVIDGQVLGDRVDYCGGDAVMQAAGDGRCIECGQRTAGNTTRVAVNGKQQDPVVDVGRERAADDGWRQKQKRTQQTTITHLAMARSLIRAAPWVEAA